MNGSPGPMRLFAVEPDAKARLEVITDELGTIACTGSLGPAVIAASAAIQRRQQTVWIIARDRW